jgi:hypothetical protein
MLMFWNSVLVFFCVGTTSLNSILDALNPGGRPIDPDSRNFVKIVATSFPNAAPFYVGWLVFQTAMHSGLELGLCESLYISLTMEADTTIQME